jgi:Xaa-Pro aminopeptidase
MFQSFEVKSTPIHGKSRIAALRGLFGELGIDGLLVPRSDEYLGEYVPESAERLAWATGFTGSAGMLMVTETLAVVFVDGRYVTQLAQQVDAAVFTPGDLVGEPPHKWIENRASKGFRLGIDPWMHTGAEVRRLEKALADKGGSLVFLPFNPVDRLWSDRPAEPRGRGGDPGPEPCWGVCRRQARRRSLPISRTGTWPPFSSPIRLRSPGSSTCAAMMCRIRRIRFRGRSSGRTVRPNSSSTVPRPNLDVERYLRELCEQVDPALLSERLETLARAGARILVDPDLAPYALSRMIRDTGGEVVEGNDPAKLGRAVKNMVELNGSAAAHLQDGVAMVEFLHWFDEQPAGSLTEIAAAQKLEAVRSAVGERMQNPLRDISFDTISGAGENAAIMHYRVTTESDRQIRSSEMFLIDSGAQYVNGTTDITRTLAIGEVPEEQKRFFTLALKGMIAISTARFPKGTRGCDLDPLARIALWKAGADFAHGTGHGVGSYLSVHEGPQRIARLSTQELLPGMILSNEPGYYRPGSFGIRIENLIYVREAEAIEGGDQPMLGFETLTFVPIDRKLIVEDLLTRDELQWLDAYHAKTREELLPLIADAATRQWLEQATAPFER